MLRLSAGEATPGSGEERRGIPYPVEGDTSERPVDGGYAGGGNTEYSKKNEERFFSGTWKRKQGL